jgi:hypothetical protein
VASLLFPWAAPLVLAAVTSENATVISGATVVAALENKWICGCGTVRSVPFEGHVCPDCGEQQLRFHRAEPGESCNGCGTAFFDGEISTQDSFGEMVAGKGFLCEGCGRRLCLTCLPADENGDSVFQCSCGAAVAIRV